MSETPPKPNTIQRIEVTAIETSRSVTPDDFLRLAIESKADPAVLDKWMDLKIKWDANEARKAYVMAMAEFRAKCPVIGKNKKVAFKEVRYNFPGLSETVETIKALEAECGLDHSWRTGQTDKGIMVTCIVTHIAGHFEETSLTAPPDSSGSKNNIQAIGSTVSYLERYTLFALLGLASQEMDTDGNANGGPKEPASQQRLIDVLIGDACKQFTAKKRTLLSADSEIDLGKFKEQLRVHFSALPGEQKQGFAWTKESIEALAGKIDVNKVIAGKESNGAGAKGQHRRSIPESQEIE